MKARYNCSLCGWRGDDERFVGRCPNCGALRRVRFWYMYLKSVLPLEKVINVLHFAPEKHIKELFLSYKNIHWLGADIKGGADLMTEDISNMTYINDSFDIVYASHVLEHVENDVGAIQEVYRVLKAGGVAYLPVPTNGTPRTVERADVNTPELRQKVYGQYDHVRLYGSDVINKFEAAGFIVDRVDFCKTLPKENLEAWAFVHKPETIYRLIKE